MVDLAHNPFFGKLQLWRAEWVMQWFAMALCPVVLFAQWSSGERGKLCACLLSFGWIAPFTLIPGVVALLVFIIHLLGERVRISSVTTRIAMALTVTAALVVAFQYEVRVVKLGLLLDQHWRDIIAQALAMNLVLVAAVLLYVRTIRTQGRWAFLIAATIFIGTFFFLGPARSMDKKTGVVFADHANLAWTHRARCKNLLVP